MELFLRARPSQAAARWRAERASISSPNAIIWLSLFHQALKYLEACDSESLPSGRAVPTSLTRSAFDSEYIDSTDSGLPKMRSRIAEIPDELMHIVARFVPCAVAFVARSDRSFRQRFVDNDLVVWIEVAKLAAATARGRNVLLSHATTILTKWPAITRAVAMPIADSSTVSYCVSSDGEILAHIDGLGKTIIILECDTLHRCASIEVQDWSEEHRHVQSMSFSPSRSLLACLHYNRC